MCFSIASLFLVIPSLSFTVNASLSATTAMSIEGTEPYLLLLDGPGNTPNTKLTKVEDLLSFRIPNGSGGTTKIEKTQANTFINAPVGMKYADVKALVLANGIAQSVSEAVVGDDDGDAVTLSNTNILGTMTATWTKNGTVISNLNDEVSGCDDIKLMIEANNVSAKTTYGVPNIKTYGSDNVTYSFITASPCVRYIQPSSMDVYTIFLGKPLTTTNSKFPKTGYNPDLWESGKGFSVKLMEQENKIFPTTGFYKATFSIIGSGSDQSQYECELDSSNISNWVLLSGSAGAALGKNCKVTYNTTLRPTTPVKINISHNGTPAGSYTIPTPTLWAIGKGQSAYKTSGNPTTSGVFTAANKCAGNLLTATMTPEDAAKYFFSREELTNNPLASSTNYPPLHNNLAYTGGRFARDVDGTFTGEWGNVHNYSGSGWAFNTTYWTSEALSLTEMLTANAGGAVTNYGPQYAIIVVICKG